MSGFFGSWFGRSAGKKGLPSDKEGGTLDTPHSFKKGDLIGQKYEVIRVLGQGGFGIVYLVHSRETGEDYALKTFQNELLADQEFRKRFLQEARIWVDLGRHPCLVHASYVDEVSHRIFIAMEYISPNERGLNSLEGYLLHDPPDLAQSLRWAIQICYGMEYAYTRGVRAHRDLKPANIMIAPDRIARITDFGLAGVLNESLAGRSSSPDAPLTGLMPSVQTVYGQGLGTPTHMAPEQFENAAGCDERSDIYSLGIILFQMAAGGRLPFMTPVGKNFWLAMKQLHMSAPLPRLDSPLFPLIQRCLEKQPGNRYQSFAELRNELERLLKTRTGETVLIKPAGDLQAWEWSNKGLSLDSLGQYAEALRCYDKALQLDPGHVTTWNNKGNCLRLLGRVPEAIQCLDKALELNPTYANAWNNKGNCLGELGQLEEAIRCYDRALKIDPLHVDTWNNKGFRLTALGRLEDAIHCYDQAIHLDPKNLIAWLNKGDALNALELHEQAIQCYDRVLELDPQIMDARLNKGNSLGKLGRPADALLCFDQVLKVEARNADAWRLKGNVLFSQGKLVEALRCYDKVLELDPRNIEAWNNKGSSLHGLARYGEAIQCYDRALELDPKYDLAWLNKINDLRKMGRAQEAVACLEKVLQLDPNNAEAWSRKGHCLCDLKKYEEAIRCYDKVLSLQPRDAEALNNKGTTLEDLSRLDEALACYDRAMQVDPQYSFSWNNKGAILYNRGHIDKALPYFERAARLDEYNGNAWYNKALAETNLGHKQAAIASYKHFLEIAPKSDVKRIEAARKHLKEL